MITFTATYYDTRTRVDVQKTITATSITAAHTKALDDCLSYHAHQVGGYHVIKARGLTLHFVNIVAVQK